MKTVFIGSVMLSKAALEALFELNIKMDLVCGLDESASQNVSDYEPIHLLAEKNGAPGVSFKKITELSEKIAQIKPDFLFVLGVSQIIPKSIIDAAKYTIGFHPTKLPKYRGRAPVPWMILLGETDPCISLFLIDEGMDSGDILHQEPYHIAPDDHATEVYKAVCESLKLGLKKCVPNLYSGKFKRIPQNHDEATFLLIRRPEDGRIDWGADGREVYNLIRAVAHPYPGAFSTYEGEKIIFRRASIEENTCVFGIPGQIYKIEKGKVFICAKGNKFIVLHEYVPEMNFIVGKKFI